MEQGLVLFISDDNRERVCRSDNKENIYYKKNSKRLHNFFKNYFIIIKENII